MSHSLHSLHEGILGHCIGEYLGLIEGNSRSSDYSSYGSWTVGPEVNVVDGLRYAWGLGLESAAILAPEIWDAGGR